MQLKLLQKNPGFLEKNNLMIPLTNYHIRIIKKYLIIISILFFSVILTGNIIYSLVCTSVDVDRKSYQLKDGFPVFNSQKKYISLLKSYPHDKGVKIRFSKMKKGESYWDITRRHGINIDTIIGANPFLKNLTAKEGIEIAIPLKDGLLFAFDDFFDVKEMSKMLQCNEVSGDYLPGFFSLISMDDIRFVFLKNCKPVIVNDSLEKLYSYKKIFQQPMHGYYTSLFGTRLDPFFKRPVFHNGIDIRDRYGTPFKAAREGMVIFTGWRHGFGKTIIIQHDNGYTSLYGHCSSIEVKKGDWVTKKIIIGKTGSTGRSTGHHLHFTLMRHGKTINPLQLIW